MRRTRKRHPAALKAKVAFETLRGEKTIVQLPSEYGGAHANQIRQWKKQLLDRRPAIFL